jgi:hypothetical protein
MFWRYKITFEGCDIMICKTNNDEVITDLEARKKYRDKYIGYVTVEQKITDPENEKIIVLYTADNYEECYKIPAKTKNGVLISRTIGLGIGGTEIGGVYFDQ